VEKKKVKAIFVRRLWWGRQREACPRSHRHSAIARPSFTPLDTRGEEVIGARVKKSNWANACRLFAFPPPFLRARLGFGRGEGESLNLQALSCLVMSCVCEEG
jgi:hypothetical protein